jgi:hypothetical protein
MSQLVKTKRQANFKDFKRFGASCVNWAFFGTRGLLQFFEERTIAVLICTNSF